MSKVVSAVGIVAVSTFALLAVSPVLAASSQASSAVASSNTDEVAALQSRVARMEAALANMSQNQDRDGSQGAADWFKTVKISGGMNLDGKIGSLGDNDDGSNAGNVSRFSGQNGKFMSLNDAYFNISADVNSYVSTLVGVTYSDATSNYELGNSFSGSSKRVFDIDQAYVTLSDYDRWPYYIRAGRQYLPFGQYALHPITKTMTQVLSESDVVALNVGFLGVSGFNAAAYVFQNPVSRSTDEGSTTAQGRAPINWGATVGYAHPDQRLGYYAKGSYIYNMTAMDAFQRAGVSAVNSVSDGDTLYWNRVGAFALNAGVNSGPYDGKFDYVTSFGSFNSDYFAYKTGKSSHPSALNLEGGYTFTLYNRDNRAAVGYGHSAEASFIGLPQDRYYVDYTVGLLKNVNVTAEYSRDVDYGTGYNSPTGAATGTNYNVITVRLGVDF